MCRKKSEEDFPLGDWARALGMTCVLIFIAFISFAPLVRVKLADAQEVIPNSEVQIIVDAPTLKPRTALPPATVGIAYSQAIDAGLTGCAVDPDARTDPGIHSGFPPGLMVGATGTVSGTPTAAGFWEAAVKCDQGKTNVRIAVKVA